MKSYSSRNLNNIIENFNNRLSIARKCIECAFGISYAKCHIIGKDIEVSTDKAINIIICTCILHNIIICRKYGNSDLDYCQEITGQHQRTQFNDIQDIGNHGCARRVSTRAK